MAEKIRALLVRHKPRDLCDLWLISDMSWRVNWGIVVQKLSLYDLNFSSHLLEQIMAQIADDWERDMRPLLPQFVSYDDTRKSVEEFLKRP